MNCLDDMFLSKGFPYKDQIEELFIVMVYCIYSQHVTSSTFSLISLFLTAAYFSIGTKVLKVPLNPNQPSYQSLTDLCVDVSVE